MKAFVLIAVLVLLGPGQAMVQDTPDIERFFPRRGFMLSGSGGTSYNAVFADGAVSLNVSAYKTSSPTRSLLTFTGVGGNVMKGLMLHSGDLAVQAVRHFMGIIIVTVDCQPTPYILS
ncbi:MAG: hypothetical protein E2O38_16725 [Proteobacteria bacterium]|nr:MAG: hypothetical protein E2O38_16725 [Pseudomonadota bacterium]